MDYVWETPEEIDKKLAERIRTIRRRKRISQSELAELSGVSHGSIKRFENTGMISLISLTKIAVALGVAGEIKEMFVDTGYSSIQEVINETKK